MPMGTCKLNIKNQFNTLANTHWQNAPQCRISHQTWPVINNNKTSELLKSLSRTECGMLIRALTGHWLVGPHAGRLKAPQNYFCRSWRDEEEVETVEHLLCFCPDLCRLSMKHLRSPFIDDLTEISEIYLKNSRRHADQLNTGWNYYERDPREGKTRLCGITMDP